MTEAEKVRMENSSLGDILNKQFITNLASMSAGEIFPVAVVFIKEFEKDGKKHAVPIVLQHQNNEDVKNKILHLECPDTVLLQQISNLIEKDKK